MAATKWLIRKITWRTACATSIASPASCARPRRRRRESPSTSPTQIVGDTDLVEIIGRERQQASSLGGKVIHPFSDLLLHDIGSGDGVPISVEEHYGQSRSLRGKSRGNGFDNAVNSRGGKTVPAGQTFSSTKMLAAAKKLRTPPLWGERTHPRDMHDGMSFTIRDAIARHKNESEKTRKRFEQLAPADQKSLIDFVSSL